MDTVTKMKPDSYVAQYYEQKLEALHNEVNTFNETQELHGTDKHKVVIKIDDAFRIYVCFKSLTSVALDSYDDMNANFYLHQTEANSIVDFICEIEVDACDHVDNCLLAKPDTVDKRHLLHEHIMRSLDPDKLESAYAFYKMWIKIKRDQLYWIARNS